MTDNTKYIIWLSAALGTRSQKVKLLASLYPDMSAFYRGGVYEWRLSGRLTDKDISKLENTPIDHAEEILRQCDRLGIGVLPLGGAAYPGRLRELPDPPAVLYVKGRLPDFDAVPSIAMVGTRRATAYGKKIAHALSFSLAKAGAVIVSGGALGIDTISHTAALEAGGTTVCVLGCGVGFPYLTENRKMREAIAERGAVISEYPPDYPPSKFTFPERNRIISGLSDGVVVVEAGEKSGSLITARLASEQGRDVFAVMGNVTSPYSQGTNALIKDGAIPVTEAGDILSHYRGVSAAESGSLVEEIPEHKADIDVSEEAALVYRCITADPVHIDKITSDAGLPVRAVLQALTELELEGLIIAERGRMYRIT